MTENLSRMVLRGEDTHGGPFLSNLTENVENLF